MLRRLLLVVIILSALISLCGDAAFGDNAYAKWQRGPDRTVSYFPIAVWLQDPRNALRYKAAGFNTYIGLWNGPTDLQLNILKNAGMKVICSQNKVGLKRIDDETIIAWMHGDEPDNAQSLGEDKGYGPPVSPSKIIEDYERIKAKDPSRPVMLNLGQGVAWDGWHGRGVRTNHPEDYAEYARGCDIVSFDIYPAAHSKPQVAGNLWYVARGVERLVDWTQGRKPVWNCIECTRISHPTNKATPHQVRAEVWMSIIHGSTGLIYFVHEWKPIFNESALLSDPEMLAEVTKINHQIADLAPVINSPTLADGVEVVSQNHDVPVAAITKRHNGITYVFAVAMRNESTKATFRFKHAFGNFDVEVLQSQRRIICRQDTFEDHFSPWDVNLYKLTPGNVGKRKP